MTNREAFINELAIQYTELFKTPEYEIAAKRYTPFGLAEKMVTSILAGTANISGQGIKNTCKKLGVKHTFKAIIPFLSES